MANRKSIYYINPKELINEIKSFKETGIISENLGGMFIKLANRYALRKNFSNYSYKDEFIQDAIFTMVNKVDLIDLNHPKCNPFAYLTKICEIAFVGKIRTEKKLQIMKENYRDKIYAEFSIIEEIENSNSNHSDDR